MDDVCRKAISQSEETLFILQRKSTAVSKEADVDSYVYHNLLDIYQSQHRLVQVSKGSNKKSFALKLVPFYDLKTQHHFILQKDVNFSKRELSSLVDSLRNFLKNCDKASKCSQNRLPEPKIEHGCTKSKDNLFANYHKIFLE